MQNEKQLISNVTDSLNDALNSLRGNQFTNVGIYIKEALTFLRKASEPATPAPMPVFSENQLLDMAAVEKLNYAMRPIAAQTEKVCAWDVIGNECDCSDCKSASAEQADAARLDNLLEKVASVAKAFHAQPKHGSPADKQLIVEMEAAAASLKQETQPPSPDFSEIAAERVTAYVWRMRKTLDSNELPKKIHTIIRDAYLAASSSPLETPAPQEVGFCVGDIDPQPIGSGFVTPAPADTGAAEENNVDE